SGVGSGSGSGSGGGGGGGGGGGATFATGAAVGATAAAWPPWLACTTCKIVACHWCAQFAQRNIVPVGFIASGGMS
ncbi:MAG: hypothetical protein OEW37_10975, partial [Rhodospirillaceae bacterium]|nr:hypothetical protein [Rhodospirillaceae bacterium]